LIRYSQFSILKIVDRDNVPIGTLKNVLCTEDNKYIDSLVIEDGKIFRKKIIIPFEGIEDIGKDSMTINLNRAEKEDYKEKKGIKIDCFIDKEVITEKGEFIGYIKDYIFNKEDGGISGFIITEGVIEDIINGRSFIPLNISHEVKDKNIIVKEEIKDIIDNGKDYYKKLLELEGR